MMFGTYRWRRVLPWTSHIVSANRLAAQCEGDRRAPREASSCWLERDVSPEHRAALKGSATFEDLLAHSPSCCLCGGHRETQKCLKRSIRVSLAHALWASIRGLLLPLQSPIQLPHTPAYLQPPQQITDIPLGIWSQNSSGPPCTSMSARPYEHPKGPWLQVASHRDLPT